MAARKGPKRKPANSKTTKIKPWEPTEQQWKWFNAWTIDGKGASQIAREHHMPLSRQAVWDSLQKTSEWMRTMERDEQLVYRRRILTQYEDMQQRMLKAWEDSIGEVITITEVQGGDNPTTTTRTEISNGNVAYFSQWMNVIKAIKELKGLDEAMKSDVTIHNPNEIEGIPRQDSFSSHSEALRAMSELMLKEAQEIEAAHPKSDG